jgi:phage shock protein A
MLRDGLRVVTSKVLDLANLTAKACQHSDEATAKTVKAISKLRARQHALRDDLDAGYLRSSTYEAHTSVWSAVMGLLETVESHRGQLQGFDAQVRALVASAEDALDSCGALEVKVEEMET